LHFEGQPSVGMIITWNGFFIMLFSLPQGIRVLFPAPGNPGPFCLIKKVILNRQPR
jgi:hypothetical protein